MVSPPSLGWDHPAELVVIAEFPTNSAEFVPYSFAPDRLSVANAEAVFSAQAEALQSLQFHFQQVQPVLTLSYE